MLRRISLTAACALAALALTLAFLGDAAEARSGPVELGAAAGTWPFMSDPDPRYRATLSGYDAITAETAMKIADLQPQRGRFDFTVADAMVGFAAAHGQQVFGHTLSWCTDSTLPAWLRNGSWSRAGLLAVLEEHITRVVSHFRGHVQAWDVVNEALDADGSRRDCLWQRVIGDDWIEHAFRFARAADPSAQLFYNETKADVRNPKYEAMLALVGDLRARAVPVDGVGLQYHLTDQMPTRAQVEDAIAGAGALGVDVHISELDVPVWYLGATLERKLARQANVYRAIAEACHAQPACFRITTWGFMDRYTWRQPWDRSLPLPFDAEYRPKPAWTAIQEALHPAAPEPAPEPVPQPAVATAPQAVAQQVSPPAPRPLNLSATVRRQRLRTLLARRALAVRASVTGSASAAAELVARFRGRVIGRANLQLKDGLPAAVRIPLTTTRLRRAKTALVTLTATATDPGGRRTTIISRMRAR